MQAWKRCMSLAYRCTSMHQLKAIHAIFITQGLHLNNYAISKLITFCALSNPINLPYASLIFDQIHSPNLYIYNTLIRAYSHTSQPHLALHYFYLMLRSSDIVPDHHTFHFVLLACANGKSVLSGMQIHNWVVKNGLLGFDSYVQTGLIRLYVECELLPDARKLFSEIPKRDVIMWNVLMTGYVQRGLASDSLRVLQDMLVSGIEPDKFCLTTGLKACAQMGALSQGKWIHENVKKRKELEVDLFIGTALVDMYAKCGCIHMAEKVFDEMPNRNAFTWAAMIGAFAVHGCANKAINCLQRMQLNDRLRPDDVVLLGALMACTHGGLLEEGKLILKDMESRYNIKPKHEHYSCIVDLLCRSGQLDEAIKLIRKMPMKPLSSVWGALLSGCRTYNNVDLAEIAGKELVLLASEDGAKEDGVYVQLWYIYLDAGRSEDAVKIRRMIGDKGIKKTPGCSMIKVDGKVSGFVSGDVSHSRRAQICLMVELLAFDLFDPL